MAADEFAAFGGYPVRLVGLPAPPLLVNVCVPMIESQSVAITTIAELSCVVVIDTDGNPVPVFDAILPMPELPENRTAFAPKYSDAEVPWTAVIVSVSFAVAE